MICNTYLLLSIYESVLKHGKYNKLFLIKDLKTIKSSTLEGRWYAEIRRTKKFGSNYDWKTCLNFKVHEMIENRQIGADWII